MASIDLNDLFNQINDTSQQKTMISIVVKFFPELAPREAEFMYWHSIGLQQLEIADMMNIKGESVKTYNRSCKSKLNVSSANCLRAIYHCRVVNFLLSGMLQSCI